MTHMLREGKGRAVFTAHGDSSLSNSGDEDDRLPFKSAVATTLEYTYPVSASPLDTINYCVQLQLTVSILQLHVQFAAIITWKLYQ